MRYTIVNTKEVKESKENVEVKCSWTLCKHCTNISPIQQGICGHPNGTAYMIENDQLRLLEGTNSMTGCKCYYGRD